MNRTRLLPALPALALRHSRRLNTGTMTWEVTGGSSQARWEPGRPLRQGVIDITNRGRSRGSRVGARESGGMPEPSVSASTLDPYTTTDRRAADHQEGMEINA
jgi:hypothetical protein